MSTNRVFNAQVLRTVQQAVRGNQKGTKDMNFRTGDDGDSAPLDLSAAQEADGPQSRLSPDEVILCIAIYRPDVSKKHQARPTPNTDAWYSCTAAHLGVTCVCGLGQGT